MLSAATPTGQASCLPLLRGPEMCQGRSLGILGEKHLSPFPKIYDKIKILDKNECRIVLK